MRSKIDLLFMKPFTVKRPWGSFRRFDPGQVTSIKILRLKPKAAFSLQYHHYRTEFWHIIEGRPKVTINKKTVAAKPGDEFFIKPKQLHRMTAGSTPVVFLEIWLGKLDETDLVRVEDRYGRAGKKPRNQRS